MNFSRQIFIKTQNIKYNRIKDNRNFIDKKNE